MMPDPSRPTRLDRFKEGFRKFWQTDNPKMAVLRDVVVAGAIVLVLLAAIWIYSGQPLNQAPVVSVESGSMMHGPFLSGDMNAPTGWSNPGFGRAGTIDPGDIVFVKDVDEASDIEVAFGKGGRDGYGGHGDVIVYQPDGNSGRTRIIHRAMLYVEVQQEGCIPNQDCIYKIPAVCDNPGFDVWNRGQDLEKYCAGSSDPINLDLERDGLRLFVASYPPCTGASGGTCQPFYSSFITKGDNNKEIDQTHAISGPVRLEWVIGKARGEIPWFGLIKLALYGNENYRADTDPTRGSNWKVLAATAPSDIWLCLFLSLGVLVAIPMVIDFIGNLRQRRRERGAPPRL